MPHPQEQANTSSPAENITVNNDKRDYLAILRKRRLSLISLCLLTVIALFFDFTAGAYNLSIKELVQALIHAEGVDPTTNVIVWNIRLPSAVMALAIGAALGLAGGEMQTILNNPLASPFTLGLSAAAAFGASLVIVLGISIPGIPLTWTISANAFLFALLTAFLLHAVMRWGKMNTSGVVLFGIALVFTFNALVSLIQFLAQADALQALVFWTMGSLARADWTKVAALVIAVLVLLPLSLRDAWQLTALRFGEHRAASFGVNVQGLHLRALARISLLAGLAVSFAGIIGFIGLVAPHIARRLFGEDHRYYLPGCAIIGGLILSLASSASKLIMPGVIVPVGIVTSLVGIPFFLAVILRRRIS